jgi:hypothetical protein
LTKKVVSVFVRFRCATSSNQLEIMERVTDFMAFVTVNPFPPEPL